MAFSKSFPKTVEGSSYPRWEEIFLSDAEEAEQEAKCRKENIEIMKQCIDDARELMKAKSLKDYQTDLIKIASVLFEKRSSHVIYWKERKAKELFDKKNKL